MTGCNSDQKHGWVLSDTTLSSVNTIIIRVTDCSTRVFQNVTNFCGIPIDKKLVAKMCSKIELQTTSYWPKIRGTPHQFSTFDRGQ